MMPDGRQVFLEDIPLDVALERFERALRDAGVRNDATEFVALEDGLGRVTARPAFARLSSPHYHACAMDGIAVAAEATRGARETAPLTLQIGTQAHYVDTGDPLPPGTDAVIMIEEVEQRGADAVAIRAAVAPFHHVRAIGEDVIATEAVVPRRRRLAPADLAALASAGLSRVEVVRQPRVAVITTGSELVDPAVERPERGAIIDSNGVLLSALVRRYGGAPVRFPSLPDDRDTIRETVARALDECDAVMVNAGSSAGSEDFTARVFAEFGRVLVHGVAIRPGHPVILAVSSGGTKAKPLFGIPGYAVSAAICADLFVRPVVERLAHLEPAQEDEFEAVMTRKLFSPLGEDEFVRAVAARVDDRLVASPLRRGAGVITSLSRANCLILVPRMSEGTLAGETVRARALRSRDAIERTLLAVGSHDVAIDLLAGVLAEDRIELVSSNVGSIAGLAALRAGCAHLAGTHLLDPQTGTYNDVAVRRYLPGEEIALVHFAQRRQGLIVAPGNPLDLQSLRDVAHKGARYVNRQKDAGTRMLLDALLAADGLTEAAIEGYDRLEFTHLAVAALVAEGSVDCGLGIFAAARALGCDFVPIASEPYELAMHRRRLEDPRVARLIDHLKEPAFRDDVEALGGYDCSAAGSVRFVGAASLVPG